MGKLITFIRKLTLDSKAVIKVLGAVSANMLYSGHLQFDLGHCSCLWFYHVISFDEEVLVWKAGSYPADKLNCFWNSFNELLKVFILILSQVAI